MLKVKIENVVSAARIDGGLDLSLAAERLRSAGHEARRSGEKFPGLTVRLRGSKATFLLFGTGKVICTGAASEGESLGAVHALISTLRALGVPCPQNVKAWVANIIASADIGFRVDLVRAAESLRRVIYEPQEFPGVIYRMSDPKAVMLIFSTGRIVCTGTRSEEDVYRAIVNLAGRLSKL
jgi:transcription initiation factor TFIID TATA-box-binding protein